MGEAYGAMRLKEQQAARLPQPKYSYGDALIYTDYRGVKTKVKYHSGHRGPGGIWVCVVHDGRRIIEVNSKNVRKA